MRTIETTTSSPHRVRRVLGGAAAVALSLGALAACGDDDTTTDDGVTTGGVTDDGFTDDGADDGFDDGLDDGLDDDGLDDDDGLLDDGLDDDDTTG